MASKVGIVDELHKPARKNYQRRFVTLKGLNDLYQADLVEMIGREFWLQVFTHDYQLFF